MEMAGQSRMLLVLLLGGQRLETPGIAVLDSLFSAMKMAGSVGSQRKKQTIKRRSRSPKNSRTLPRRSELLSKSKRFWTGYTKRFLGRASSEPRFESIRATG